MRVFSKKFTLAAAGGLTAIAISSGAMAYAQTEVSPEVATTQETPTAEQQRDGEEKIAKLADKLGVTTEELTEALKTVKNQEGGNKAKQLADALGIEESKVEQALVEDSAEQRKVLENRLDAAVTEGKLTEEDKTSVLKAYDAGVFTSDHHSNSSSMSQDPSESTAASSAVVEEPTASTTEEQPTAEVEPSNT